MPKKRLWWVVGLVLPFYSSFFGGGRGGGVGYGRGDAPAVGQLPANVFEVVVAHVVDAKDEAVLVLRDALADVGEELVLVLAGLLGHLGEVEHLGAF